MFRDSWKLVFLNFFLRKLRRNERGRSSLPLSILNHFSERKRADCSLFNLQRAAFNLNYLLPCFLKDQLIAIEDKLVWYPNLLSKRTTSNKRFLKLRCFKELNFHWAWTFFLQHSLPLIARVSLLCYNESFFIFYSLNFSIEDFLLIYRIRKFLYVFKTLIWLLFQVYVENLVQKVKIRFLRLVLNELGHNLRDITFRLVIFYSSRVFKTIKFLLRVLCLF